MHELFVSTLAREDLVAKDRVRNDQVIVANQTLSVDLIVVNMTEFDVIPYMDWLVENRTSIDCCKREVVFSPQAGPSFKFKGTRSGTTLQVVSMMKAKKLI